MNINDWISYNGKNHLCIPNYKTEALNYIPKTSYSSNYASISFFLHPGMSSFNCIFGRNIMGLFIERVIFEYRFA